MPSGVGKPFKTSLYVNKPWPPLGLLSRPQELLACGALSRSLITVSQVDFSTSFFYIFF